MASHELHRTVTDEDGDNISIFVADEDDAYTVLQTEMVNARGKVVRASVALTKEQVSELLAAIEEVADR